MAKPIAFKPIPVDFRPNLARKLEKGSEEHAEALLLGLRCSRRGATGRAAEHAARAIGAKDKIFKHVVAVCGGAWGIAAIRNLLTAAKILTELDSGGCSIQISKADGACDQGASAEREAPSLLQLARRATSEDSRRGLSFMTLGALRVGRSLKN